MKRKVAIIHDWLNGMRGGEKVLEVMHKNKYGKDAAIIGKVESSPSGRLLISTGLGSTRIADVLAGELLPRIC